MGSNRFGLSALQQPGMQSINVSGSGEPACSSASVHHIASRIDTHEWQRKPLRQNEAIRTLPGWRHDPMHRTPQHAVAPAMQHVAHVRDQRPRPWRDGDELAGRRVLHLESADVVLEEADEVAVVGVRVQAGLAAGREGAAEIVVQVEVLRAGRVELFEPAGRDRAEAGGEGAEDGAVEGRALVDEGEEVGAEGGQRGGEPVRQVRVVGLAEDVELVGAGRGGFGLRERFGVEDVLGDDAALRAFSRSSTRSRQFGLTPGGVQPLASLPLRGRST
jgi:hypothetical protein